MVEEREKIRKDRLIGILEGLLLFAGQTFPGVFKISTDAEQLVLEGSDFGGGIGFTGCRCGRFGGCRLAVRQNNFWIRSLAGA
ncbi:MAG: hypothetical protein RL549_1400 [Verrucomicrobiota bacterium]